MNVQADVGVTRKDNVIYILATGNFHSEALASMLHQGVGAQCACCADLADLNERVRGMPSKVKLLLIDSSEKDFEAALAKIQVSNHDSSSSLIPALYNLPVGTGIERRAFTRGVRGFFYRHDSLDHMVKGIRALLQGELWMSRDILVEFALKGSGRKHRTGDGGRLLTQRETQILALVSAGASNEEIADTLVLSPHTVKTHLYNVFKKIKVPNRFQASLWAAKYL
jgi:LuxR family transcriptional regulator, positive regulator of biofilm formation